ncbi:50S ribosomal protein L34e [Candidatus Woesearchaeota archaeon]|nr:50S ribosomal protein L34e [Candidatus Woesearchaeota archaeon]
MQHKQKSRTLARKQVKTPGARVVTHYVRRKPKQATCAQCGAKLKGVPRGRPAQIKATPKSSRRPERPYGGVLCSACTRAKLKGAARQ